MKGRSRPVQPDLPSSPPGLAQDNAAETAALPVPIPPAEAGWLPAGVLPVVALAALPVLRIGQLTSAGLDAALITTLLFAGAAWNLQGCLRRVPSKPGWVTTLVGYCGLALGAWQLAWIGTEDYWFLRIALVVWSLVWICLLWGRAGLAWGWRVWVAFGIWAGACGGAIGFETGRFGEWVSLRTIQTAGWVLWQFRQPVSMHGTVLKLEHGAMGVGEPCTGLPLALLLLVFLLLAALLLRLRWLWVGVAAGAVVLGAFGIGVARVLVMTQAIGDPERFEYWHGHEGNSWFTAAGVVLLGWLVARGPRLDVPHKESGGARHAGWPPAIRWAWVPVVVAGGMAWLHPREDPSKYIANSPPPPLPGFVITNDSGSRATPDVSRHSANASTWIRTLDYESPDHAVHLEIQLAYIPVLLSAAPEFFPETRRRLQSIHEWRRRTTDRGGEFCVSEDAGQQIWLAFVSSAGVTVSSDRIWHALYRDSMFRPASWRDWLSHRSPMRDKQAYWLAVRRRGAREDDDRDLAAAFFAWTEHVRLAAGALTRTDSE